MADTNLLYMKSIDIVFEALNKVSRTNLKSKDFLVEYAEAIDQGQNTRIRLRPYIDSGFYCDQYFKYNRINLADYKLVNVVVPKDAVTVRDIINGLRGKIGIPMPMETSPGVIEMVPVGIDPDEVEPDPLPVLSENESVIFKIRVKHGCFLYFNELQVELFKWSDGVVLDGFRLITNM